MAILGFIGMPRNVSGQETMLLMALFILAGFISILVHELGHALAGMIFNAKPYIVLQSFGGYAAFPGTQFTRVQSFIVTAAGPFVQIILGIATFMALAFIPEEKIFFLHFMLTLCYISIIWAVLNLTPVHPLDGGQILFAAMGPRREKLAWQISMVSGIIVGIAMISSGIFPYMGMMVLMMVYQNYQTYSSIYR